MINATLAFFLIAANYLAGTLKFDMLFGEGFTERTREVRGFLVFAFSVLAIILFTVK